MASTEAVKAPQPKITLYWLNKSRAHRILWLLEELGVEYDVKVFKRGSDMLAPAELRNVHPLGKAPILTVQVEGAEKPIVLAESGPIIEYLVDHFGQHLVPRRYVEGKEGQAGGETEEWLRYRYFMHYAEGTFMVYVIVSLVVSGIRKAPIPFFIKPITNTVASMVDSKFLKPNFDSNFDFLEDQLATAPNGGGYFAGSNLTAADFIMSFAVEAGIFMAKAPKEKYPRMHEYVERLHANEAYKRAVAKEEELTGEPHALL